MSACVAPYLNGQPVGEPNVLLVFISNDTWCFDLTAYLVEDTDSKLALHVHAFFISNAFFRPRLKCCLAKFKFKITLTLPDKKVFKMLVRKSKII